MTGTGDWLPQDQQFPPIPYISRIHYKTTSSTAGLAAEAAVAAQEAAKAATAEAAALAAAQAAAAQVAAEQAAAAQAAEAAAHRAAALRAAKAEAAKKAEPPVPRFATPETRPSNPPSSAAPRRYEPPYGGQPPARSYSKATRRQPAAATASDWLDVRQVTGGSAQTSGRARGDATNGRSRHLSADREVSCVRFGTMVGLTILA